MPKVWQTVALGVSCLGIAVFCGLSAAGSEHRALASVVVAPILSGLALLSALGKASRVASAERAAWVSFAASYALTGSADVVWLEHHLALAASNTPYTADALYVVGYAPMLVGLLLLPAATVTPALRVRLGLDLATVFIGAAMGVGLLVIAPAAGTGADTLAQVVAAGPPVADVVVLAGITLLLLRGVAPALQSTLLLLFASFGVTVGADLVYARASLLGTYAAGDLSDASWFLSNTLFVWAATRPAEPVGEGSPAGAVWQRVAEAVPYVGMLVGFGTLVALAAGAGESHPALTFGAVALCAVVAVRQAHLALENRSLHAEVAVQAAKSERLLRNVLPGSIATRLLARPAEPIADHFAEATVLFADLVGFTQLAAATPPHALVELLDDVFSRFDGIADRFGIEKIKTIGDAYMAASGVPRVDADHAVNAANAALAMIAAIDDVNRARGLSLGLRVGLHSGPVVAGIIGTNRFCYDLWGDVVNTASRMESHGVPHAIHVSASTHRHLVGRFDLVSRGSIEVKGKGPMETWLLQPDGDRDRPAPP